MLVGGDKRTQQQDIAQAIELARDLQESNMAKTQTHPWDAANHLETKEDMAAYLEAAMEDGDPALITAALGDITRSKGMTQISRDTGLGRESLCMLAIAVVTAQVAAPKPDKDLARPHIDALTLNCGKYFN